MFVCLSCKEGLQIKRKTELLISKVRGSGGAMDVVRCLSAWLGSICSLTGRGHF